jgi:hypothetical protein
MKYWESRIQNPFGASVAPFYGNLSGTQDIRAGEGDGIVSFFT